MRNHHPDSDRTSGFLFSKSQTGNRTWQDCAHNHVCRLCLCVYLGLSENLFGTQQNTASQNDFGNGAHQHRPWRTDRNHARNHLLPTHRKLVRFHCRRYRNSPRIISFQHIFSTKKIKFKKLAFCNQIITTFATQFISIIQKNYNYGREKIT